MAGNIVNLCFHYRNNWQGELLIRIDVCAPTDSKPFSAWLTCRSNSRQREFGYNCYMPEKITKDSQHPKISRACHFSSILVPQ